jgi:thiamine-monophosphate kinase
MVLMKLSDIGEFGLIERIRKAGARSASRALIGIGDDAAALLVAPGEALLATTDILLEGVHFDLRTTDLYSLGWKAAAANLSDIAAMGGLPRYCLTALGIPASLSVEALAEFYRGIRGCLEKFGAELVGGDTCRSRRGFSISVTLLGETREGRMVTRKGAAPGDRIFVTGTLGDSGAGLELLRKGRGVRDKRSGKAGKGAIQNLIARHLRPVPRVHEGAELAASGAVSAMIDVSDGLSSDLGHLCDESGFGAEVFVDQIPLSKELRAADPVLSRPALDHALFGGEDYELLFTVPPEQVARLRSLTVRASEVGVVTRVAGMVLVEERGNTSPLPAAGYDHFRKTPRRKTGP